MYLNRLELQGFKSFPDKIKLEFNKGITAVVGPNGSGKSNISDAIRWVLGEQSAKSLRGGKMEDVIFSGTENRRGLGFAEVSLTIDNSDKKMKLDYTEITVTRRVYRSGDSEFLLNGVNCRLKDIHEMFMDTGVGKEGYSIIGQGRIQEILNSRSEDKRLLFEEATGIAKSKSRRNETSVKLEKERQNLIRVNDIIAELELQIEPLRNQSEVAKRYIELKEKLKILQVNIFLKESDRVCEEINEITKNINIVDSQILDCIDEKELLVNERKVLKENLAECELTIKKINLNISDLKYNIEEKENEIKITKEQINFINIEIDRIYSEINKKGDALERFIENKNKESEKFKELESNLQIKEEQLRKKEMGFEFLTNEMIYSERQIKSVNNEIIEKVKAASDIKGNIERLKSIKDQMHEKDKNIKEEIEYVNNRVIEETKKLQELEINLNDLNEKYKKREDYKIGLEKKQNEKREELKLKKDEHISICNVINELNSKSKVLTELEESYEGYYSPVKFLLKERDNNKESFEGICGVVAELMSVPKDFEICIEIALGGSLQNIVTKTETDAKKAIEYLKRTKGGRATFLPITAISYKKIINKDEVLKEIGVLGIASDLIKYEDLYSGIFSNLLGRVIVVDNINNGLKIFKKYNYLHKIVTLDGETLNSGGAMTGGSISRKSGNILSRSREIKEINEKLNTIYEEEIVLKLEINKLYDNIETIAIKINETNLEMLTMEKDKMFLEHNVKESKTQVNSLNDKKIKLKIEKEQLESQNINCSKNLYDYKLELNEKENEIFELQNNLERSQGKIAINKEQKENKVKELTDIKLKLSEISQSIKMVEDELNWINGEIKTLEKEIRDKKQEIEIKKEEKFRKEQNIKSYEKEIENKINEKDQVVTSLNNNENMKDKLNDKLEKLGEDEKENFEMLSRLKDELTKLNFKKERVEEDSRNIYDYMWEEYSITLKRAKEYDKVDKTVSELRLEEKSVKFELNDLGAVNVNAIEEYKSISKRYEFLIKQHNDILEAEKQLLQIIDELTVLMEKQFAEQFKLISESFSKVFSEMFGGGTAFLKLQDSSKPLESPIDIVAKPPGKNLQSMSLMSGGELALTAISLLFGILRLKPSPFCILDEVEAPLDDANVKRYANFLKNFCHETQFILITHRKGTMECADVLYGVTMQEHGVSKLVSAKLTEEITKT